MNKSKSHDIDVEARGSTHEPPPADTELPEPRDERADADPDQPFVEGAHDILDPDLRHRLISEAAYRLYLERGCAEGYELDDWLQAETEVDHLLLNPRETAGGSGG